MTYQSERAALTPVLEENSPSYVDWSAVIAGIVLASAISFVMLAFGSAIGLTFTSIASKGAAIGAALGAALWFLWVEMSGFMAGAYLTGRLRKHVHEATEHETEVRDGSHGLLVWAGGVVVGAVLALGSVTSAVNTAGNVVKAAADTAAQAAPALATNPMQYYTDTLLRVPPQATAAAAPKDSTSAKSEINTILMQSSVRQSNDDDKAYVAQLVSQQTGLSADDAKKRVDQTYDAIAKSKADAAAAAETVRRVSVIAAFLLAASLLLSAAAAFWAATQGGRHRNESAVFEGFFKRV